jgi:hypothetical protein
MPPSDPRPPRMSGRRGERDWPRPDVVIGVMGGIPRRRGLAGRAHMRRRPCSARLAGVRFVLVWLAALHEQDDGEDHHDHDCAEGSTSAHAARRVAADSRRQVRTLAPRPDVVIAVDGETRRQAMVRVLGITLPPQPQNDLRLQRSITRVMSTDAGGSVSGCRCASSRRRSRVCHCTTVLRGRSLT